MTTVSIYKIDLIQSSLTIIRLLDFPTTFPDIPTDMPAVAVGWLTGTKVTLWCEAKETTGAMSVVIQYGDLTASTDTDSE